MKRVIIKKKLVLLPRSFLDILELLVILLVILDNNNN